jgi:NAD-dependent deacetylase
MSDRERLSKLIEASGRVVVFTGAGISTESGVPDFRSPGGVWSRMKPITYGEFIASEAKRREAWSRAFSGVAGWVGKRPNAGHHGVARLIASGKASLVVTQNVDNLHQDSGVPSDRLIELHGNASYAACLDCGLRHELAALKAGFLDSGAIPVCRDCGGLVKTATISFGQALPAGALARAEAEARACDLFLVLGSSLQVHPAAGLPLAAKRSGAMLAIVNRDPTPQDEIADLVLHEPIGEVMTEVAPHAWAVSAPR